MLGYFLQFAIPLTSPHLHLCQSSLPSSWEIDGSIGSIASFHHVRGWKYSSPFPIAPSGLKYEPGGHENVSFSRKTELFHPRQRLRGRQHVRLRRWRHEVTPGEGWGAGPSDALSESTLALIPLEHFHPEREAVETGF